MYEIDLHGSMNFLYASVLLVFFYTPHLVVVLLCMIYTILLLLLLAGVAVGGKSSVCLICMKYRIIILIIIIKRPGEILLSYIANTSRTHALTHSPSVDVPITLHSTSSLTKSTYYRSQFLHRKHLVRSEEGVSVHPPEIYF